MTRRLRRLPAGGRSSSCGDEGNVLLVAVLVAAVTLSLTLVVTAVAVRAQRASGLDRQQGASVAAAEAGVDSAYAAVQNSGATALPCSWPANGTPASIGGGPDQTQVLVSITYRTGAGALLPCPAGSTLAAGVAPAAAVLSASAGTRTIVGGSTAGRRVMESAVNLTPVRATTLDNALFAEAAITVANGGSLDGHTGSDADVYTNGAFVCANGTNRDIHGSVLAQGNILFDDRCNVDGEVWAGGTVTVTKNNETTIGGSVRAHNVAGASPGASLMPKTTVGKPLTATRGISWDGCSASAGTCTAADPGPPTSKPFPIMRADSASLACWTGTAASAGCAVPGGFTKRELTGDCGTMNSQILNGAASWPTKSIVVVPTGCLVDFAGKDLAAQNDIAIFARGGIRAAQQTDVTNTGDGRRSVYWMVPYENGSPGCTAPSVASEQRLEVSSTVQLLMYSPCTITISNNSTIYGQIYSGNRLDASNSFDLDYRPLPVFGIDPSSRPTLSYRLDVLYKREQR